MNITRETAKRTAGTIAASGSPEQARHDVAVQLQAIAPYTDRELSKVATVLNYVLSKTDAVRGKLLAQLAELAPTPEPEPTGCEFCGEDCAGDCPERYDAMQDEALDARYEEYVSRGGWGV